MKKRHIVKIAACLLALLLLGGAIYIKVTQREPSNRETSILLSSRDKVVGHFRFPRQ